MSRTAACSRPITLAARLALMGPRAYPRIGLNRSPADLPETHAAPAAKFFRSPDVGALVPVGSRMEMYFGGPTVVNGPATKLCLDGRLCARRVGPGTP